MISFRLGWVWDEPSALKRQNPARGRVRVRVKEWSWLPRGSGTVVLWVLLHRRGGLRLYLGQLPSCGALKGGSKQFIHEPRHRLSPVTGFMVQGADHALRDAGHVVPGSGHDEVKSPVKWWASRSCNTGLMTIALGQAMPAWRYSGRQQLRAVSVQGSSWTSLHSWELIQSRPKMCPISGYH